MREIKFRVWNGADMIYDVTAGRFGTFYVNPGSKGDGLHPRDSASLTPGNTKYSDTTPLMQYTGLKDKNGVEIYEGDILRALRITQGKPRPHVVKWDEQSAAYRGIPAYGAGMVLLSGAEERFEVVGNIYENANLLKEVA